MRPFGGAFSLALKHSCTYGPRHHPHHRRPHGCLQFEAVITNAKRLPWKNAANGNAYGLLPASIRSDLIAIANRRVAPATLRAGLQPSHLDLLTAVASAGLLNHHYNTSAPRA